MIRALAPAAVLALATVAAADPPAPSRSEILLPGREGSLQAWLWRPSGAGPFPALVYNHGSERDPIAGTDGEVGPFFAARGFVVLFPVRRGAGKSQGRYWRDRVQALPAGAREQGAVDALVAENDDVA